MNRKKRAYKISTLFILYLSVFTILLLSVLIFFFSFQIKKTAESRLIDFGKVTSTHFALDCVDYLFSETYPALNEVMKEYADLQDVTSVIITDRSNMVVASTEKELIGKEYWEPRTSKGYVETGTSVRFMHTIGLYGRTLGYLYLSISKGEISGFIRRMVLKLTLFGAGAVLIIIVLASLAVRRITSFSKDLINITRNISMGNYSDKIKANGFYELDMLSSAINAMEKAIEERERKITESSSMLKSIFNSPSEINIWSVDKEYRYTFFNKTHREGMKRVWDADIEIGKNILDYIHDTPDKPGYRDFVKNRYDQVLSGKDFKVVEQHKTLDGNIHYFENHSSPIVESNGEITGLTIFAINITKRKMAEMRMEESLKEKEILLKEIHHRVKNNLQVISSLLNLQLDRIKYSEDREIFIESINRINSIAMVHEKLYSSSSLNRIDMNSYFTDLFYSIQNTFDSGENVKFVSNIDDLSLSIGQAVPLGLICNEVFTNSFKYAFKGVKKPLIKISMKRETDSMIVLKIEDNGIGFNVSEEFEESGTLGLTLIKALTEQLYGTSTVTGKEQGVLFTIRFPEEGST